MQDLAAALDAICDAQPFATSYVVKDLVTGRSYGRAADVPTPSASTRKTSIMMAAMEAVHKGRLRLDQPVTIEATETVAGETVKHTVKAQLDYVSGVIEPSGDYRVWAKVKNPQVGERHWLLRPGSDVTMAIQVKDLARESAK